MPDYDFSYYQSQAATTAVYRDDCLTPQARIMYTLTGLMSEVGEVSDKLKKFMRDQPSGYTLLGFIQKQNPDNVLRLSDEQALHTLREDMRKELGDCLWYLAMLADEVGLDLHDVMLGNLSKLLSRAERNKLHGSGDDR